MGWVKTKEFLPDELVWVLMAIKFGKGLRYDVGMLKGGYFMDTGEILYHTDRVPFWCEIEEPEVEK